MNPDSSPVLFGAFDRHNVGDLLFPHLLEALLPGRSLGCAGLVARDLRPLGGHRVMPLAPGAAHLVHAGGELLTCTAWQAAVMLQSPREAAEVVARYDAHPDVAAAWAARTLGTARAMPYVAGREFLAAGGKLIFNAVGGVEWESLTPPQREEVKAALRSADWLSVRDRVTQGALQAEGIAASLCPDAAVMLGECCGDAIRAHEHSDALRTVRAAFPQGFLACQFSADFADDASLDALALGLGEAAAATGLGLVLFRAGAAPWHDDPQLYQGLLHRLPAGTARVFHSLHLWDVCALVTASRGTVASSLHARLVALAYGLPRVSLTLPQQGDRPGKVAAFAGTWEPKSQPWGVAPSGIGEAVKQAFAAPADVLADNAADLRRRFRESLVQWDTLLPATRLAQ